jgi:hypothetical protein
MKNEKYKEVERLDVPLLVVCFPVALAIGYIFGRIFI